MDEEIMIFRGLLIFFGVCLAFVTTAMALLHLFQHCWMAEYRTNGCTVTASVNDVTTTTKYQTISVTIDYPYYNNNKSKEEDGPSKSLYATTIRKQIKCSEEDLIRKKTSVTDTSHSDCCLFVFEDGTFSFDEAVFQVPTKLSIQVVYLPNYPHSALPKSQVFPTSARRLAAAVPVVVTLMLLSIACIHLGVRRSPLLSFAIAVGSCLLFTLFMYRCIRDAMELEFTENTGLDVETIGNLSTLASESRDRSDVSAAA